MPSWFSHGWDFNHWAVPSFECWFAEPDCTADMCHRRTGHCLRWIRRGKQRGLLWGTPPSVSQMSPAAPADPDIGIRKWVMNLKILRKKLSDCVWNVAFVWYYKANIENLAFERLWINPCTHEIISAKWLWERKVLCSNTDTLRRQFSHYFSSSCSDFLPQSKVMQTLQVWLSVNLFSHCDGPANITALNNTEEKLAGKENQWWMIITSSDMLIHMRPTSRRALSCMHFYFRLILRLTVFAWQCNFKTSW